MGCSRSATVAGFALAALAATTVVLAPPAGAGGSFAGDTDALRASHGLAGYRTCGDLDALAARWAAHMASTGVLAHDPNTRSEVSGWRSLGENAGEGGSESSIQSAFVGSPEHYANLTSSTFTEAGYGTAVAANGTLWVDEIFRLPASAPCSGSAAPTASRAVSGATGSLGATSRSMRRTAVTPAAPAVPVDPAVARTASARARLTRLAVTPAPQLDVVAAALAFAQAMTVS